MMQELAKAGYVAQWLNVCLVCLRPCAQTAVLQKQTCKHLRESQSMNQAYNPTYFEGWGKSITSSKLAGTTQRSQS